MKPGLRRCGLIAACLGAGLAAAAAAAAKDAGDLSDRLRVGGPTQLAPYAYLDNTGVYAGFSIDYLRALGQKVGSENVLFYPATPAESLRMLAAGDVDCIQAVRYTSALARNFLFAAYYLESPSVLFTAADRYDLSALADLQGKRVAVPRDDPAQDRLRQVARLRVLTVEGPEDGFALLKRGEADAYAGERMTTLRYLGEHKPAGAYKTVGREIAWSRFGLLVRKDDRALAKRLAKAAADLDRGGERDRLFRQWFGEEVAPQVPLTHRVIRWVFVFVGGSLLLAMIVLGWNLLLQRELELKAIAVEKAQLDRAIAEEKSRFEATVQSMTEGLMLVEPDGRIAYVNDPGAQYLGRRAEELLGQPLAALTAYLISQVKEREPLERKLEAAERHPTRPAVIEYAATTTHRQDIRLKIFPVRDSSGRFAGRGVLIEDLTHEREVDRLKSEFVSIASHELRTPMTSILGFSELMLTQDLPAALTRRYTEQIHSEAQRLTRILNDMLDLSYLESGQGVLERQPVGVSELVAEVVESFRAQLRDRRELRVTGDGRAAAVLGDRDKLSQVLWNLLSNADKYSPPGREVLVSVRRHEEAGADWALTPDESAALLPAVELKVTDYGQGIPADQLSLIFVPFHRVETAVHTIRGTGLGLAIVKRIVEGHGGRVWAESRLGERTEFTVLLPESAAGKGQGGPRT